jgi:hypothetical protein
MLAGARPEAARHRAKAEVRIELRAYSPSQW